MKKNKKGILAPAVLKIILAAIGIGFLFYLLSALYFNVKDSRDLKLAKETLEFLMDEIKAGRTSVDIFNPEDWILTSWPHDVRRGGKTVNEFPQSCSNLGLQSCICFCKYGTFQSRVTLDLTAADCDDVGICLNNERFLIEGEELLSGENTIKIENPPMILDIDYNNKVIRKRGGGGF